MLTKLTLKYTKVISFSHGQYHMMKLQCAMVLSLYNVEIKSTKFLYSLCEVRFEYSYYTQTSDGLQHLIR